jgi:hypothetical protein
MQRIVTEIEMCRTYQRINMYILLSVAENLKVD